MAGDALYFTLGFFSLIRNDLRAHLLIKCGDPEFRDVLYDAHALFDNQSPSIERIDSDSDFDEQRWCSWTMERTSGEFAGFSVQVVRLREHYPKRPRSRDVVTWIVTTNLALSCSEIREVAHLRWRNARTTSSSGCPACAAPNGSGPEASVHASL